MILFDHDILQHIKRNVVILEVVERRRVGDTLWVVQNLLAMHLWDLELAHTRVEHNVVESNTYASHIRTTLHCLLQNIGIIFPPNMTSSTSSNTSDRSTEQQLEEFLSHQIRSYTMI